MGTLIFPGGPGLALMAGPLLRARVGGGCISTASTDPSGQQVMPPADCTGSVLPQILGIAVLLIVVLAPVVVAIVLLNRARARTALENH